MTYTIAVFTANNSWWWTEELSETCRVYSKNKFEELVRLVGFIIRIYYEALSPEYQILVSVFMLQYVQFQQAILLDVRL